MDDELKKLDSKVGVSDRNKKYIVITVLIAIFFVAVTVLEAFNVISELARRILIGAMILAIAIWYAIVKKRNR